MTFKPTNSAFVPFFDRIRFVQILLRCSRKRKSDPLNDDLEEQKAAQNENFITEKNNPFPSFFRERVFLHETNGEAGREAN